MTYKEKFHKSTDWKQRVLIMELFHLLMQSKHKNWHLSSTAKYFGVSMGLVSENLALAHAMDEVEDCTSRVKALAAMRSNKKC